MYDQLFISGLCIPIAIVSLAIGLYMISTGIRIFGEQEEAVMRIIAGFTCVILFSGGVLAFAIAGVLGFSGLSGMSLIVDQYF